MKALNSRHSLVLFLGDILVLVFSLWLSLFLRYGEFPLNELFKEHIIAFIPLMFLWFIVFFISGLYERHTVFFINQLPYLVIKVQVVNSFLAVAFFYFASYLKLAPKTILFLFILVSSIVLILWRNFGYKIIGKRNKDNALIIGNSAEISELYNEVNHNDLYPIRFLSVINPEEIRNDFREYLNDYISNNKISIIVLDSSDPKIQPFLSDLYSLVFMNINFLNSRGFYESIFKRVPLSLLGHNWFLDNASFGRKVFFDSVKRLADIVVSFFVATISLIIYPIVYILIKLDDGGVIFSIQERVGKDNRPIKILKFRTMTNSNDGGKWGKDNDNKITKVGVFLRKTRIDELPQLWNVLKGDLSLIGPRPEFFEAVKNYEKEIPYYAVRHLIKPGLSGWAQIYHDRHPHHNLGIEETMEKLTYDLYYIKNRSLFLDFEIALKTIRILLAFKGK
jgi:exopolysaccharide biosynthesis polyprenyl glycosylphosphotransferase